MSADTQLLENIMIQVRQLSPEFRVRLIQRITELFLPSKPQQSNQLEYGKYRGNKMSTLDDFAIAEWNPTDRELDGY